MPRICSPLIHSVIVLCAAATDEEKTALFRRNLFYTLEHPDEKGILGRCFNESPSEWPMVVFFRACFFYYKLTKDKMILDSLHRHFLALDEEQLSGEFRHVNALEGILLTYGETKDSSLLEKAVSIYEKHNKKFTLRTDNEFELHWNKLSSGKNFALHGVTFSEEVKIPVLLYLYTGKNEYLTGAEKGLEKVLQRHEQIPGLPSSNEDFAGKDPLQGYESCTITDFTWALGYFLQATGRAHYADRIEKIIYNALPGAVNKDFSALLYYSSPNQLICTEYSNHTFYLRGQDDSRQFRAAHSTQCCAGNIQRALPSFVLHLWMLDENDSPVAAMYGASKYSGIYQDKRYTITEETAYPEEGNILFRFTLEENIPELEMPFTFRIPAWCENASLLINAEEGKNAVLKSGSFVTITRKWKNGDTVQVLLAMTPVQKCERYWTYFEMGPLVFSLPVACRDIQMEEGRFTPHDITPEGNWNYAVRKNTSIESGRDEEGVFLKIKGYPVSDFDRLEDGRYTPEIPLFFRQKGGEEMLTLRRYGSSPLRLTAFPLAAERKLLPVYQVKTSCPYPYDFRKELSLQKFLPEDLSEKENLAGAHELQAGHDSYYDLMHHFGPMKDVLCYVYFRVWAEEEGTATFAVSASDGAECFVNGKKYFEIEPPSDGEFMAPFLFKAGVRKGFNLLTMKVCEGFTPLQYRKAWGAKAQVYMEKEEEKE